MELTLKERNMQIEHQRYSREVLELQTSTFENVSPEKIATWIRQTESKVNHYFHILRRAKVPTLEIF